MNDMTTNEFLKHDQLDALAAGRHGDPFSILGPHRNEDGQRVVRTLQPHAASVALINSRNDVVGEMALIHDGGIFSAALPPRLRHYRLRVTMPDGHSYDTAG
jgi:1,4-alpha-glucan branching enzyme